MNFPKLFKPKYTTEESHMIANRNNIIYHRFMVRGTTVKQLAKEYGISESFIRRIISSGSRIVIRNHRESKVAENFL